MKEELDEFKGYMNQFTKEQFNKLLNNLKNEKFYETNLNYNAIISVTGIGILNTSQHYNYKHSETITAVDILINHLNSFKDLFHSSKISLESNKASIQGRIGDKKSLNNINKTLRLAKKYFKDKKISKADLFDCYLSKLYVLRVFHLYEEVLETSEEALKFRPVGLEYESKSSFEIPQCKSKIKIKLGYSNPLIDLYRYKGDAYLNLKFPKKALSNFEIAYDNSIDYASKIFSLDGMISSQIKLDLKNEAISNCLEMINFYNTTDFPKTYSLLQYIFNAYLNYCHLNLNNNEISLAKIKFKRLKEFLIDNFEFLNLVENKVNELGKFISQIENLRKKYPQMDGWDSIIEGLNEEEIQELNNTQSHVHYIKLKQLIPTSKRPELIPAKIKDIEIFCKEINDKRLKSELSTFLDCYNKLLDKASFKFVRPTCEIIIDLIIKKENISKSDYKIFLDKHPKINSKIDKNKNINLTSWAKIQLLRSFLKNKDIKRYKQDIKDFLDTIEELMDKMNSEMHGAREFPLNIQRIIENLHYVISWYTHYLKMKND